MIPAPTEADRARDAEQDMDYYRANARQVPSWVPLREWISRAVAAEAERGTLRQQVAAERAYGSAMAGELELAEQREQAALAEREELRDSTAAVVSTIEDAVRRVQKRVRELEAALRTFGSHTDACHASPLNWIKNDDSYTGECDCGLDAALRKDNP